MFVCKFIAFFTIGQKLGRRHRRSDNKKEVKNGRGEIEVAGGREILGNQEGCGRRHYLRLL